MAGKSHGGPIYLVLTAGWLIVIGAMIRCEPLLGWMQAVSERERGAGSSARFWYDASKDPARGLQVSLPGVDEFGRSIARGKGDILLIMGGSCSSCSVRTLQEQVARIRSLSDLPSRVLVVLEGSVEEVLKAGKDLAEKGYWVVADEGKLKEQINGVWSPRGYVLDSEFRVVSFQKEPWGAFAPAPVFQPKEVKG